ncbi:MAG TPA: hypothetical protein VGZ73_10300 [Bryobacteraceae bacterium]|nr:hypothetical protein [Bryobacteraceae bacterium]
MNDGIHDRGAGAPAHFLGHRRVAEFFFPGHIAEKPIDPCHNVVRGFASLPERNQQKRIGWRPKPGAWREHFMKGSGVSRCHQESGENIIRGERDPHGFDILPLHKLKRGFTSTRHNDQPEICKG